MKPRLRLRRRTRLAFVAAPVVLLAGVLWFGTATSEATGQRCDCPPPKPKQISKPAAARTQPAPPPSRFTEADRERQIDAQIRAVERQTEQQIETRERAIERIRDHADQQTELIRQREDALMEGSFETQADWDFFDVQMDQYEERIRAILEQADIATERLQDEIDRLIDQQNRQIDRLAARR